MPRNRVPEIAELVALQQEQVAPLNNDLADVINQVDNAVVEIREAGVLNGNWYVDIPVPRINPYRYVEADRQQEAAYMGRLYAAQNQAQPLVGGILNHPADQVVGGIYENPAPPPRAVRDKRTFDPETWSEIHKLTEEVTKIKDIVYGLELNIKSLYNKMNEGRY